LRNNGLYRRVEHEHASAESNKNTQAHCATNHVDAQSGGHGGIKYMKEKKEFTQSLYILIITNKLNNLYSYGHIRLHMGLGALYLLPSVGQERKASVDWVRQCRKDFHP
jgi:hypothetical protein